MFLTPMGVLKLKKKYNYNFGYSPSTHLNIYLKSWLMEPGGSMPHKEGLFNNPYPEPSQPNSSYSYLYLNIPSNFVLPSIPRPS